VLGEIPSAEEVYGREAHWDPERALQADIIIGGANISAADCSKLSASG